MRGGIEIYGEFAVRTKTRPRPLPGCDVVVPLGLTPGNRPGDAREQTSV